MSRSNVTDNVTGFDRFVNHAVAALAVLIIAAGYVSALGRFAGIA